MGWCGRRYRSRLIATLSDNRVINAVSDALTFSGWRYRPGRVNDGVLKGSIASKSSTVWAFGKSANNRRRYAYGSRPLARAVETML